MHFTDFHLCSRGILHPYISHRKLKSFYRGKLIHFFPFLAPNKGRVGCTKNESLGQFSSTKELSCRNKNERVVFLCKGLSILASRENETQRSLIRWRNEEKQGVEHPPGELPL